jgi:hypothetical protein
MTKRRRSSSRSITGDDDAAVGVDLVQAAAVLGSVVVKATTTATAMTGASYEANSHEVQQTIAQLKAALQAQDEVIQKKNQEIQKKNQEIQEKVEEFQEVIQKKNQEIQEKDEVIQQKDKVIQQQESLVSVRDLLKGMPSMVTSPSCRPSITTNEAAQNKVTQHREAWQNWHTRSASQETNQKKKKPKQENDNPKKPKPLKIHEPAKIRVEKLDPDQFFGFKVNEEYGGGTCIPSQLKVKSLSHTAKLPHFNETSPQDYLSSAIEDVVMCCGLSHSMTVIKEATLFSLRPDLVVVRHEGFLLFAVEVKNPGSSVFQSETASGQTLNYLKGLKQQGLEHPFAMLSTYNQSVIARFGTPNDADKHEKKFLLRGAQNAKDCPKLRHAQIHRSEEEQTPMKKDCSSSKECSSPKAPEILAKMRLKSLEQWTVGLPRPAQHKTMRGSDRDDDNHINHVNEDSAEGAPSSLYDYQGREICYSQTFEVGDLYKALTLLLESSLVSFEESRNFSQSAGELPHEDATVDLCHDICTLYEDSFAWEKVAEHKVTYNWAPPLTGHSSSQLQGKVHVKCTLGTGGTGRTLLLYCPTGEMFAAKLYLIKETTQFAQEDREKEFKKAFKKKKALAMAESEKWKEIADLDCSVIKLNGVPALTMPFFPPLSLKQRSDALSLIKGKLKNLATNHRYKYKELRWRHFGVRWAGEKMEITLLDLGSLERIPRNEDIGGFLSAQVEELKSRMKNEPVPASGPVLIKIPQ